MCVVYILTSQKICQPIFVWGMSNQYYTVNTLIFNNLYLYGCIYICLTNASMYGLFTNLLILSNNIIIDQSKDMSNMTYL